MKTLLWKILEMCIRDSRSTAGQARSLLLQTEEEWQPCIHILSCRAKVCCGVPRSSRWPSKKPAA